MNNSNESEKQLQIMSARLAYYDILIDNIIQQSEQIIVKREPDSVFDNLAYNEDSVTLAENNN